MDDAGLCGVSSFEAIDCGGDDCACPVAVEVGVLDLFSGGVDEQFAVGEHLGKADDARVCRVSFLAADVCGVVVEVSLDEGLEESAKSAERWIGADKPLFFDGIGEECLDDVFDLRLRNGSADEGGQIAPDEIMHGGPIAADEVVPRLFPSGVVFAGECAHHGPVCCDFVEFTREVGRIPG